jgi:hypothetical protein
MKYEVPVETYMYCTGTYSVEASSPLAAHDKVQAMINKGALNRSDILDWSDPVDEDGTFATTGDVD